MKTFLGSILIVGSIVSAATPVMAYNRCLTPTIGCEGPSFPSMAPVAPTPTPVAAPAAVTPPSIPAPEAAPPSESEES